MIICKSLDISKLCHFSGQISEITDIDESKSTISIVEVDGDACVDRHSNNGADRQDQSL